ncbi:MAG TPA: RNA methyltransferase [Candidatus Nanoarchaeia archaeon]|nr:RNA methyltransferase [Candidatus Nanoarchaeia archaeon]
MITVVLVEPALAGNIGSICRVMKNFGVSDLVLVDPKCDHLSSDSIKMSVRADDVLRNAKVADRKILKTFDVLIGTTAKTGTDFNINRVPIDARELRSVVPKKGKIALLIGNEADGLNNEDIKKCDFTVTIPANPKYPTLNIAQAVGILLYELFESGHTAGKFPLATAREKEQIEKLLNEALERMKFNTPMQKETQRRVWKRILGKSFLTKREAMSLMGFLRLIK